MANTLPTTVGQAQAQSGALDTYTSNIQDDIIKGWNDRRLSNNVNLTSLVPFVQLIGVFNVTEYEKMFGVEGEDNRKEVYFTPNPAQDIGDDVLVSQYLKDNNIGDRQPDEPSGNKWQWIQDKLIKRFIDLFIYEGSITGTGDEAESVLNMTPTQGILMAEYKSQAAGATDTGDGKQGFDSTGGIGITDLQVEYGKSNALGSRKLNMRITVNDPAMLNDQPEYSKLSTMNGEFIIIYGWSNPQIIEGFDATPPPIKLPSTANENRDMMIIPLDNMDTGGYWSAVKLNITNYDFSFNEMGQLEINVGFMDKTSMLMNSTRISSIASTWKKIMSTGDYDPSTTSNQPVSDFTNMMVTLADDTTISVADLVANEQNATSVEAGSNPTGEAPSTIDDLSKRTATSFLESLNAVAAGGNVTYTSNTGEYNQESYWNEVRSREKLGFPYGGPGIRSYEKVTIRRPIDQTAGANNIVEESSDIGDEDIGASVLTEEVTAYRVKVVYYYLGWVLEAMRLSLNSQNRSRVREGDKSFNPQFKYLKNESTSQLKSAFQNKVSQADRASSVNEQIQNAIIRLKENCMPPYRQRGIGVSYREIEQEDGTFVRTPFWPSAGPTTNEDRPQAVHTSPCAGSVVVEEIMTGSGLDLPTHITLQQGIANKIFPTPEKSADALLPMRGHRVQIFPSDAAYSNILTDAEKAISPFWVFKPDWYLVEAPDWRHLSLINLRTRDEPGDFEGAVDRTIDTIPMGGSRDGFNPFDPTAYKAADRGGRFFYKVTEHTHGTVDDDDDSEITSTANVFVMEVDAFRQSDTEIWQLTQRKWFNLYTTYLGNYFEQLIRNRLAELEEEGKTVEDIYNEPVDLDFLTSKVFNNWRSVSGSKRDGPRWTPCTWDQVQKNFPADEDLVASIEKTERQLREARETLEYEEAAETSVTETITEKQIISNNRKREIEEITGGMYERGTDAAGNELLTVFSNWKGIVRGTFNTTHYRFEKISEWESESGSPKVTLEWLLWKERNIATDNFSGNPQAGLQGTFTGGNSQSRWKDRHKGEVPILERKVEEEQQRVNTLLVQITNNSTGLGKENNNLLDRKENISAAQSYISTLESRLARYSTFIAQDREGDMATALSPYDDTSDFDDVLEIDMGRDQPMRLTTKVAQQWYQRFSSSPGLNNGQGYNWIKGVTDVTNYGPRPRGLKYYRHGRTRNFQFDASRRNNDIKGNPRIVLDVALLSRKLQDLSGHHNVDINTIAEIPIHTTSYLPYGTTADDMYWNMFGNDGIPISNYDEFLALFGLVPPMNFDNAYWPIPGKSDDAEVNDHTMGDEFYYMVDDASNIILRGAEGTENAGWFVQSGWYVGYGGSPVYLYPNQENAVQIDPESGNVLRTGNNIPPNSGGSDRMHELDEGANWHAWGGHYRLASDEHNLNLTLDEKRALVFQAGSRSWPKLMTHSKSHDYDGARGSTEEEIRTLGRDVPARGSSPAGESTIGASQHYDWSRIGEKKIIAGGITIRKGAWDLGYYDLSPVGTSNAQDGYTGTPVGKYKGPLKNNMSSYTNKFWPYGTGLYLRPPDPLIKGAHTGPERSPTRNYLPIGDLLEQLPNKGFFTTVNNDNYSGSTITPDGNIIDGKELNVGFVKFIIENIYAPTAKNRRIASRSDAAGGKPRGAIKVINVKLGSMDEKWRLQDTTYGHLFKPEEDDTAGTGPDISFTDFAIKNIASVADMPIRRDIVDNLMNKNNTNMSLAQFIQEIINPNAIGINTGNIHVSLRQKAAGNFEVFQATKNWRAKAAAVDMEHEENLFAHKYPVKHFLIDYKAQDSLIENIDMSSKFDPAIALTYDRAAASFAGNPTAIVKFLSYGNVAADLQEFLSDEDKINNSSLYTKVFNSTGLGGSGGDMAKIVIAHNSFFDSPGDNQTKIVSDTVMAKFLMQKPERMNKLNALIQASDPDSNFATELLSYYMRRCTITIHGTTNLTPFNSINISGVLPNLEGLYLIISVRESVTTQNFQTIIEGVLLRPRSIKDIDKETHDYSDS